MTALALPKPAATAPSRIELSLGSLSQLFNSMDPSPFYEKDLDKDAEQFILDWVQELPRSVPVNLTLHLRDFPADAAQIDLARKGISNHFRQRAEFERREWRRLLRQGRIALAVGLAFLLLCLLTADWLAGHSDLLVAQLTGQSLTVGGWVAMWRPFQIYLYDWWPLWQRECDLRRLATMTIDMQRVQRPA